MCLLLQAGQTAEFTVTTTRNVTHFWYQVRYFCKIHFNVINTIQYNTVQYKQNF